VRILREDAGGKQEMAQWHPRSRSLDRRAATALPPTPAAVLPAFHNLPEKLAEM